MSKVAIYKLKPLRITVMRAILLLLILFALAENAQAQTDEPALLLWEDGCMVPGKVIDLGCGTGSQTNPKFIVGDVTRLSTL